MSIKMSVRYGEDAKPISEMTTSDTLVCFGVRDDKKVLATGEFDFRDLPDENQQRVSLYGLNKLLTDRTSDEKDKEVKIEKMQEVFDLLVSGEWAKERTAGAIIVSAEVEALARLKELTVVQTQQALSSYDKDTRKKILGRKDIADLAKVIREERVSEANAALLKSINLDDMI